MLYRMVVGECREVGACLMKNKAELYQWLDPIVMHQMKPNELARLKVAEYAIQERVIAQHTERACGTQQVRCDSGAQQWGMWDVTARACGHMGCNRRCKFN